MSTFDSIVLSAFALLLVFWWQPGIKAALARSKHTPSDWPSVFLPLACVVMFIIFLITMV
jgi:TRAP-type C4-dicarboxylate transport system permease small subunit